MLRLPGIAVLLFIAFGNQLGFFAFQSIWVLFADKVVFAGIDERAAQQAIGGILALVGLMGVLTQIFLVKPIVKRFGERAMVAGGMFVRSIPFLLMALFPFGVLLAVSGPLISFGNGLVLPGVVALLTYLVPPDERGFAIGLSESVQGVGRIGGPLIAGLLFDNVSYSSPMLFAAVMGFITAALALLLWRIQLPVREPVIAVSEEIQA
jgi:MFS family permease